MLSRVLRATPRIASAASRRTLHVSAVRRDLIQDLYSTEIKAFKPRVLSEKDAEGSVLHWKTPSPAKVPGEELDVSQVDAYAKAPVDVEEAAVSTEEGAAEPAAGADWFPIESADELDAHSH